jgi:ribonuclease HI
LHYYLYTDGACQPNPGKGGWSFILTDDNNTIAVQQGFCDSTTSNRMELTAALNGLRCFEGLDLYSKQSLTVYSDSKYFIDGAEQWSIMWQENEWKKKDGKTVKNLVLWQSIREILGSIFCTILFQHVKGHSGHEYNEKCDTLAVEMINKHG